MIEFYGFLHMISFSYGLWFHYIFTFCHVWTLNIKHCVTWFNLKFINVKILFVKHSLKPSLLSAFESIFDIIESISVSNVGSIENKWKCSLCRVRNKGIYMSENGYFSFGSIENWTRTRNLPSIIRSCCWASTKNRIEKEKSKKKPTKGTTQLLNQPNVDNEREMAIMWIAYDYQVGLVDCWS